MIKKGSKAPKAIKELQTDLKLLGYKVEVDGRFGDETDKAVRAFQKDNDLDVDGKVGSQTQATIDKLTEDKEPEIRNEVVEKAAQGGATPWMSFMKKNIGQREIAGKGANPFIQDLFNYTTLKGLAIAKSDETAWCAACTSAALEKSGYKSTHSASAASYDKYGEKCEPKFGAIITVKRTGGSGRHVTFFDHWDKNGNMVCLGGNQGNMIKYSTFSKKILAASRWPVKA